MTAYASDKSVAVCHAPKCAGWSVKKYLAENLEGVVTPKSPGYRDWDVTRDPDLPKGHLRVADFGDYIGIEASEFDCIIAVTRNPYIQQVSQWRYWRMMWQRGHRMPQHAFAATHPFPTWVQKPRSDYHAVYEYHDTRPPAFQSDVGPYGVRGTPSFVPYWYGTDGTVQGNVELIEIGELSDRLPSVVAEATGEDVGDDMPRKNSYGHGEDWQSPYNDAAAQAVERKFAWAFDELYEVWRP